MITAAGTTERYNFVVLSQNNWFGPWMNRQHLFSIIGQEHKVLYSGGAWFTWDLRSELQPGVPFMGGWRSSDNVNVFSSPFYWLRNWRFPRYDTWVMRRFCKQLCAKLEPGKRTVLYIFHPDYAEYIDHIDHDLLVFHAFDDYERQAGWNDRAAANKQHLLERADIVFAVSSHLQNQLAQRAGRSVTLLNNGVDYEKFSTAAPEPPQLARVPHPRIGLLGNINEKIDLPLVERMARARPGWSWVLVGGVRNLEPAQAASWSALQALDNVYLLGHQPPASLPGFAQSMDSLLMCYRIGEGLWTDSIYPLKLHEYLAAGKPVVSADIIAVREFADQVDIVEGDEQWLAALDQVVEDLDARLARFSSERVRARQAIARCNQWQQRVEVLLDCIGEQLSQG